MMEVYAGCSGLLRYQDRARHPDAVEDTGELDNTLIIYIQGDNGASGEGSIAGIAQRRSASWPTASRKDIEVPPLHHGRTRRAD